METVPQEIKEAVRVAVSRDYPESEVARFRVCESNRQHVILRAFLTSKIIPSPYLIYRIELPAFEARELKGNEADPFEIPNYK